MELDASLSWLALAFTPGLASRLSGRLLEEFGSPEEVFRAPLPRLERCRLPAAVAQAVFKKQVFKLAEKELASNLQQCPREFRIVVNEPSISIVGTRNGRAIGVLGTAGNVCYAKENRKL